MNQHPLRNYSKQILEFIGESYSRINLELGHKKAEHFLYRNGSTQFALCKEKTYNELIDIFNIDKMQGYKKYAELVYINRTFNRTFNLPEGAKFKSNVLKYKKDYNGFHPTQKPIDLMSDLIKTYSNVGDLVLDFTFGSGTTLVAAKNLGRRYIGIEISESYCRICEERLSQQVLDFNEGKP